MLFIENKSQKFILLVFIVMQSHFYNELHVNPGELEHFSYNE